MNTKIKIKTASLPGGSTLSVRPPDAQADLQNLVAFFSRLPPESRRYLRYDVTDPEACRRRLLQVDGKNHWRMIAELDGRIVGDATLDRKADNWASHVAEMRGVVDPACQHLHVGPILFGELVEIVSASGVERLVCEVMERDTERIALMEDIGFTREATLKNYARDLNGRLQDLVVMTNDLEDAWSRLLEHLEELDIKHARNS
jgi:ribosomal protein S18 acetylase RimI-like enzyme